MSELEGLPPSNPLDLDLPCVLEDNTVLKHASLKRLTQKTEEELKRFSTLTLKSFHETVRLASPGTPKPLIVTTAPNYMIEHGNPFVNTTAKPKLIDTDGHTPYYKVYFLNKDHIDLVGEHPKYGTVVVSVAAPTEPTDDVPQLRCLDDMWVFIPSACYPKNVTKELKAVLEKTPTHLPDFNLGSIKLAEVKHPNFPKEMAAFEQKMVPSAYKYCKDGQMLENEMFGNGKSFDCSVLILSVDTSPEFEEFLQFLGERITLKGWKEDCTGTHSVFTKYEGLSIMFHVSTLLPFNPNDAQQVEKKRHIGNDVLVIVFKDTDSVPFDPLCVTSDFNLITVDRSKSHLGTYYRVAVTIRDGSKVIEPQLSADSFEKNEIFKHFLLTKMINSERAAMRAPAFRNRMVEVKEQQMRGVMAAVKKK